MAKGPRGERRPADVNARAVMIAKIATGEIADAAIIFAIVVMSSAIAYWQSFRSGIAVRRLREGVAPTATVLRDAAWTERLAKRLDLDLTIRPRGRPR